MVGYQWLGCLSARLSCQYKLSPAGERHCPFYRYWLLVYLFHDCYKHRWYWSAIRVNTLLRCDDCSCRHAFMATCVGLLRLYSSGGGGVVQWERGCDCQCANQSGYYNGAS